MAQPLQGPGRIWLVALIIGSSSACAPPHDSEFSVDNARAHVEMLAGTIGSRPIGTEANARARQYLVDQLLQNGFEVRVQETDAQRPEHGLTARVSNIIAVKAGMRPEAIALVAHYDSRPDTPGAADDGLGTAVCVEAGRVLAARPERNHTLMVILTDGEEIGLMGAAAVVTDPAVVDRIAAFLNFEAAGASGPSRLFQAGPGSPWLVESWARHAPSPRGSSLNAELYERLPNDTDFTIFSRAGLVGLNFAATGDGYAYHTARDTPDRLPDVSLRHAGDTALAIVEALDRRQLIQTDGDRIFFDVGGTRAVAFGGRANFAFALLAVAGGLAAWVRLVLFSYRTFGLARLLLTVAWGIAGTGAFAGATLAAAWLFRAGREVYHPWYAHPERFLLLLAVAGITGGWAVTQLSRLAPARVRGCGQPAFVWVMALPVWVALAAASYWFAPGGAYLWTIPLLAAASVLLGVPIEHPCAVRVASVLALAAVAALWLPDVTLELPRFAVALLGRVPLVTPFWVYPALVIGLALMLAPPLLAVLMAADRRTGRDAYVAVGVLTALTVSLVLAFSAPAYTRDRPMRRAVRYVNDAVSGLSFWEVGGNEPGLDLAPGAPPGWERVEDLLPTVRPVSLLRSPFLFRTSADPEAPPADVRSSIGIDGSATKLEISVVPHQPGIWASFVLPGDLVPEESNLAGTAWQGTWRATYVAPRAEGISFRATFRDIDPESLRRAYVAINTFALPGGTGWQLLPEWLPQERTVWDGQAQFLIPVR
jgi:hypothetical protein